MASPTPLRLREQDLAGNVAVITGASRGIGRAVALHLALRGCSILGTCFRLDNIQLITDIKLDIELFYRQLGVTAHCPKVVGVCHDITSPNCAEHIAMDLSKHSGGRVDIFVNNAADSSTGTIGQLTVDEIQRSMISNIQTPVLIVDELVKRKMFQPESRIIYISSVRSRQPWSEQLMYAAGKSAGESLCRTWSMAFGDKEEKFAFMTGTTANAVSVGLTQTDSVMQCPPDALEKFKTEFHTLQSIPRFGQPDDVADVVGMLCGRDARWITGQVISASGGGIKIG